MYVYISILHTGVLMAWQSISIQCHIDFVFECYNIKLTVYDNK